MQRSESSTTQVNASLRYCHENAVNIFGPVREIKRACINKMRNVGPLKNVPQEPKIVRPLGIRITENVKKHSAKYKSRAKELAQSFLRWRA